MSVNATILWRVSPPDSRSEHVYHRHRRRAEDHQKRNPMHWHTPNGLWHRENRNEKIDRNDVESISNDSIANDSNEVSHRVTDRSDSTNEFDVSLQSEKNPLQPIEKSNKENENETRRVFIARRERSQPCQCRTEPRIDSFVDRCERISRRFHEN